MNETRNFTFDMTSRNDNLAPSGINTMGNIINTTKTVIAFAILIIGIFGLIGNILNLIVFGRMGFSEPIHMSYAAMAVSDIGSILTTIYISVHNLTGVVTVVFASYHIHTDSAVFMILTASWPHLTFSRVTALLTAWVSLERCLCVLFPTKVKVIVTPKVTKAVLGLIYVIGFCPVLARYVGLKSRLAFNPENNVTTFLLYFNAENSLSVLNRFAFALYGAIYPLASWIVVAVCAAFLIVKLRQSAKWRSANSQSQVATPGHPRRGNVTGKETRVTKTVLIIACVFVFTAMPVSFAILIAMFEREFSVRGSLREVFMVSGFVSFLFTEINSSINFIVYVSTGSKFRAALFELFSMKQPKI